MMKVLIADDHQMFLDCLIMVLDQSEFEVVACVSNGLDTLKMAVELAPQMVILDVNMPGMNGLDIAGEILRQRPLTRIVFLTCRVDESCVRSAMQLGAKGYVSKSDSLSEIRVALQKVAKGEIHVSAALLGTLVVQWLQKKDEAVQEETLSLRERQVLKLIAEGYSTKEIAGVLHLSPKTADSHRTRLMAKLGVHEVAGLVRYAVRQGLVVA